MVAEYLRPGNGIRWGWFSMSGFDIEGRRGMPGFRMGFGGRVALSFFCRDMDQNGQIGISCRYECAFQLCDIVSIVRTEITDADFFEERIPPMEKKGFDAAFEQVVVFSKPDHPESFDAAQTQCFDISLPAIVAGREQHPAKGSGKGAGRAVN